MAGERSGRVSYCGQPPLIKCFLPGAVPLALAIVEGTEQRAPMAHAVIGSLITSTLLTPFVVPVVYTLLDDLVLRLRRGRGRGTPAHAPRVVPAPQLAREPEPVAAD